MTSPDDWSIGDYVLWGVDQRFLYKIVDWIKLDRRSSLNLCRVESVCWSTGEPLEFTITIVVDKDLLVEPPAMLVLALIQEGIA